MPSPFLGVEPALDVHGEPGTAPRLEPADLGVGDGPGVAHDGAQRSQLPEAAQVPEPGADQRSRLMATPGGQGHEGLHHGGDGGLGEDTQQVQPRVVLEHGPHVVTGLHPGPVGVGAGRLPGRLPVADSGLGGDDHPGAGHLGPPAQVDVGAVVGHGRVEAPELGEEVGPHQQAGGGGGEDVTYRVVLLLVQLAAVDERHGGARLVDRQADAQQPVVTVPVDQLGRHDAGVGSQRLLDQEPQGVGLGGHVVVAEDQEGGALDGLQHVVGGGGEAGRPAAALGPPEKSIGEDGGHPGAEVFATGTVDDQDRLVRVVLGAHRL